MCDQVKHAILKKGSSEITEDKWDLAFHIKLLERKQEETMRKSYRAEQQEYNYSEHEDQSNAWSTDFLPTRNHTGTSTWIRPKSFTQILLLPQQKPEGWVTSPDTKNLNNHS